MDVGFVILKVEEDSNEVVLTEHCDFSRDRDVFKRVTLEPGSYALVPLTTGACVQRTQKASTEAIPPKFTFEDTVWPHPYFSSTINDIFRKLDLAVNGVLSAEELNQFGRIINERLFLDIKQSDFTSSAFSEVSCNEEGVSLLGFKQLLFRNFSNVEIMNILKKLGYDEALNSTKSRAFMVSFQAAEPITVRIKDIMEGNFHKTAWEQFLSHMMETEGVGDNSQEEDDYTIFSYTHPHAYACSFA